MNFHVATTTAGVLAIVQSGLLLAWDIFFLFVQFQPSVFGDSHQEWMFCFEEISGGFQYGVNGIVIVSTVLNFIWLVISIAALLSNDLSLRNASGLRVWVATTVCIVLSDIALTLFFTLSTTVAFRDLFKDDKEFMASRNSTYQEVGNDVKCLPSFTNNDIYKGYVWFLVGVSRIFLITVFINVLLVYFVSKRIREIRLGQSRRKESKDEKTFSFFDSAPNMYSEPTPMNEYEDPFFDAAKSNTRDSPVTRNVLYPKLPIEERRNGAERRISARNYDLKPDVLPNSRELSTYAIKPSSPQVRDSLPSPRVQTFFKEGPNIPDPDYDELPLKRSNGGVKSDQMGIDNPAMNPLYEYPHSKPSQEPNRGSFPPVTNSPQRNSYNNEGYQGNTGGLRRY